MPPFRPAYLIHGDDHGRIAERRANLRLMAERESGAGGVELLEGETCTADAVTAALSTMTFALGRRFVIADGVERWKDADAAAVAAALKSVDPDTLTVAFFGREEGRYKVPPALIEAVEQSSASSAERKLWTLADALVAGDEKAATRALLELRAQGERVTGLLYQMVRRLRDALAIAEALQAGKPAAQVKKTLRMPSFAADRLLADVAKRDVEAFRRALELMADLELETRGGGGGVLSEDTAAVRAV